MGDRRITITAGDVTASAALTDGGTADLLWEALPITGQASTWGNEIFFTIPVKDGTSPDAKEVVEKGEIAYWAPGNAFCIFWGPTPASIGNEIRPASEVNPLGMIEGDPTVFSDVRGGATIKIEKA